MTTDRNVFLRRMPAGIPGDVSRKEFSKCTPEVIDVDAPPPAFGIPVTFTEAGKVTLITSASDVIRGFLVRPYPIQSLDVSNNDFGEGLPIAGGVCDRMQSGYMTVKCQAGTPAKGAPVYVRWGEDSGTQGTVEAETSGNQAVISGCYFTGEMDENGNVEIEYNV